MTIAMMLPSKILGVEPDRLFLADLRKLVYFKLAGCIGPGQKFFNPGLSKILREFTLRAQKVGRTTYVQPVVVDRKHRHRLA